MKDLKGASLKTIANLCSETLSSDASDTPLKVNIPLLQRPYSWNKDNIESLISDFLLNSKANPKSKYFVGSVVVVSNDNEPRIQIVDGQQRITTMFLLNYIRYCLLVHLISDNILRRNLIEARDSIKDDLPSVLSLLMDYDHESLLNLCKDIKSVGQDDSRKNNNDEIDRLIKTFNELVGLPYPMVFDNYPNAWCESSKFDVTELAISYTRPNINVELKNALKNTCIYYAYNQQPVLCCSSGVAQEYIVNKLRLETGSENEKSNAEKKITEIVNRYPGLNDKERYSLAIAYAWGDIISCSEISVLETPQEKAQRIIDLISDLLSQLQMCSVVTCEIEDAYTLFEVLNDRALEIPDLDLIKDKYLQKYYTGNISNPNCDSIVESTDDRWHTIFDGLNVKKCSLISYFSATFIHADPDLDNKNNPRYRKFIQNYLDSKTSYNENDLRSDVDVYEMVKEIIDKFTPSSSEKPYISSNKAENSNESSIVNKAVQLINFLNYDKVKSSLFNIIIQGYYEYVNVNYDKNQFSDYLTNLQNKNFAHDNYPLVCNWAFFYWRTCILSSNKDKPLMIARLVIKNIHKSGLRLSEYSPALCINDLNAELNRSTPGVTFESKIEQEFNNWIGSWNYETSQSIPKHKVRILLINLFKLDLDSSTNTLYLPTTVIREFSQAEYIDLDHLEPKTPDPAVDSSEYYYGADVDNQVRKTMIHCLGNMMVIDKPSNIRMSNIPLYQALDQYYCNPDENYDSLLVEDIKTCLDSNNSLSTLGHKVPQDGFFNVRRNRIIAYCKALLKRGSYNDPIIL